MEAPACPPATTKSTARSLLKSVVTAPAPVASQPTADSAHKSAGPSPRPPHEEKLGLPAASVIEAAGAGARSNLDAAPSRTLRHKRIRLCRKPHRNRRRHIYNRIQRQLRE